MRGMNSESIDLIYLDPPFNSNHDYAAPIGSIAAGAAFKDTWGLDDINIAWHGEIKHEYPGLYALLSATREICGDSMMSYLIYMAIRIMEMRRILKPTGSIYLHCDPYASHYLKLLMDAIWGKPQFRRELVWDIQVLSGFKTQANNWIRGHDTLLYYVKTKAATFNKIRQPHTSKYEAMFNRTDAEGRKYMVAHGTTRYWDEIKDRGKPIGDVWSDVKSFQQQPTAKENVHYPTQKPLALLERIIRASSNEGDVVLDPFCGCATACIAAEKTERRWGGIDIAPMAADLVKRRMRTELGMFYKGIHRTDIPRRTDLGELLRYNDERNKRYLYGEQGGYCNGCEHHFELRNMTVDHIVARAHGGTDHISNLQLLCGACNSMKGTRSHEYLLACLTDKGWVKRKYAA